MGVGFRGSEKQRCPKKKKGNEGLDLAKSNESEKDVTELNTRLSKR